MLTGKPIPVDRLANAKRYAAKLMRERYDGERWLCDCCGVERGRPDIEHNHVAGHIRGRVCRSCNIAIAKVEWQRDNPARYQQVLDYLKRTDPSYQDEHYGECHT